jgi:hypothetical protein
LVEGLAGRGHNGVLEGICLLALAWCFGREAVDDFSVGNMSSQGCKSSFARGMAWLSERHIYRT